MFPWAVTLILIRRDWKQTEASKECFSLYPAYIFLNCKIVIESHDKRWVRRYWHSDCHLYKCFAIADIWRIWAWKKKLCIASLPARRTLCYFPFSCWSFFLFAFLLLNLRRNLFLTRSQTPSSLLTPFILKLGILHPSIKKFQPW